MSTIKDVAKEAGLSVGTVSNYLNGNQIKENNKILIEHAIEKLNFKLNHIARGLRTNKTRTIGIIIPSLTDIYSTMLVGSIEQKFYEFGYNVFTCDSRGSIDLERQKAELLVDKLVEGIIIYPCSSSVSYLREIQDKGVPVVIIDRGVNGISCDQILIDNVEATYGATKWLIENNHTRIGLIGDSQSFTAAERLNGYKKALKEFSIDIDQSLIKLKGFEEQSGFEALTELMQLEKLPTAVLACNYYTTIGMVKAIYNLKLKIPEQLSIIGFDNIGLTGLVQPPLSIIVQPMEKIGIAAAEMLIKRLSGDMDSFPMIQRLKAELIINESARCLENYKDKSYWHKKVSKNEQTEKNM